MPYQGQAKVSRAGIYDETGRGVTAFWARGESSKSGSGMVGPDRTCGESSKDYDSLDSRNGSDLLVRTLIVAPEKSCSRPISPVLQRVDPARLIRDLSPSPRGPSTSLTVPSWMGSSCPDQQKRMKPPKSAKLWTKLRGGSLYSKLNMKSCVFFYDEYSQPAEVIFVVGSFLISPVLLAPFPGRIHLPART